MVKAGVLSQSALPKRGRFVVSIHKLLEDPNNERRTFRGMEGLIASVKAHGIVEPITVTPEGESYRILTGHRRYRAAKAAGFTEIEVIARDPETALTRRRKSIISNVQREDIGAIEMAEALQSLLDEDPSIGTQRNLAALAKGKLGEDKCNLLGSLLTTQFQLAAMARADTPERERVDFFLFLDEFQNFSTDSFASLLSEARKFRLNLTLSHQYIAQLSLPVQKAVFGNVGTLISFKIGYSDAVALGNELGNDFPPARFVELNRFHVIVRLLNQGTTEVPFHGKTQPPRTPIRRRTDRLISHSRMRFSTPRNVIERKLANWLGAG